MMLYFKGKRLPSEGYFVKWEDLEDNVGDEEGDDKGLMRGRRG